MTPADQNRAIAELCGWKPTTDGGICWDHEDKPIITYPDYCGSLDLMHEAEMKLIVSTPEDPDHTEFNYRCWLDKLCGHDRCLIHFADAPTRAEALLRVKGRWV